MFDGCDGVFDSSELINFFGDDFGVFGGVLFVVGGGFGLI